MKKGLLFVILLLLFNNAFSQEEGIDFLPVGLNFLPLKGNMYEPRLGVVYFPDDRSLKVDIGNSIDIILLNDKIKQLDNDINYQLDENEKLNKQNIELQNENAQLKQKLTVIVPEETEAWKSMTLHEVLNQDQKIT